MKAFEVGEGERLLFAFTHPDDELALAAFIRRTVSRHIPVTIVWTHSTEVRRKESEAALTSIGMDLEHMVFYDAPDRQVVKEIENLRKPFSELIESYRPTRIVTHAFEQGHIDHDATNLLVNLCFQGPVFEAPFYHTYLTRFPAIYRFSLPDGEERIELTAVEQAMKKEMTRFFPSQTVRRNVLAYELAHAVTFRKKPLFQFERLRRQVHFDYRRPNHPPALAKRVVASSTWRQWMREIEPYVPISSHRG